MKKIKMSLFLALLLLTGISGCGRNTLVEQEGELVFLDQPEAYGYN